MAIPESTDNDKPVIIPADAVSFHYDPKVGEGRTIVDFIVEHTKKIKPLASADLDSFSNLGAPVFKHRETLYHSKSRHT